MKLVVMREFIIIGKFLVSRQQKTKSGKMKLMMVDMTDKLRKTTKRLIQTMDYIIEATVKVSGKLVKEEFGIKPPGFLVQVGLKKLFKEAKKEMPGIELLKLKVKKVKEDETKD